MLTQIKGFLQRVFAQLKNLAVRIIKSLEKSGMERARAHIAIHSPRRVK